MKAAASNTATGPAMAFMGMGMAGQVGGVNAQDLYAMGRQQAAQQPAAEQARMAAASSASFLLCCFINASLLKILMSKGCRAGCFPNYMLPAKAAIPLSSVNAFLSWAF